MQRRSILGILSALAAFSSVVVSCSGRGRVIPASKLSDIYAEMFLADQWLTSHYSERRVADTSLFYEPIFKKYGYTLKDYDASVHHYIEKPDDYAKILKTASLKLDDKAKYLRKVDDYYSNRKVIDSYKEKSFDLQTLIPEDTMMIWRRLDSLSVRDSVNAGTPDSLKAGKVDAAMLQDTVDAKSLLKIKEIEPISKKFEKTYGDE